MLKGSVDRVRAGILSGMDSTVYIATTLISLVLLYVIVRFAVKAGTASALQEHEVWKVDGSMDKAVAARRRKLAFDGQAEAELRAERGES